MTDHSEHSEEIIEETPTVHEGAGVKRGVSIRIISAVAIIVAMLLALFAFSLAGHIANMQATAETDEHRYMACSDAIDDLQDASDYLTTQARMFVVTGDPAAMDAYFEELYTTNRRGNAVQMLKSSFPDDLQATAELQSALNASDELATDEFVAMRLAAAYYGVEDMPNDVARSAAVEGEQTMTRDAKLAAAQEIIQGDHQRKR